MGMGGIGQFLVSKTVSLQHLWLHHPGGIENILHYKPSVGLTSFIQNLLDGLLPVRT